MDYTIERSRRRTLTLTIKPDRTIIVKAPHLVPKMIIDQFVRKNHEWIEKRLERLATAVPKGGHTYENGDVFRYMGKEVTLLYGSYSEIQVTGDKLHIPLALKFRIKKELEIWYISQGKSLITHQVEKFAQEMGAAYVDVSFSDTKSRWGSCSHDNRLQFNWRLIMAPTLVLNYVVIHELAHTSEKNHSRDFWRVVEKYNPSYRQNRKWLKDNGHTLVF